MIALTANTVAAEHVFESYQKRKSPQTQRRQKFDLLTFQQFLEEVRIDIDDLYVNPSSWSDLSWGLVEAYVAWMLNTGYAIGSINVRLSTVKTYAQLAFKAGAMTGEQNALIHTVQGFRGAEAVHVNAARSVTHIGSKQTRTLTDDEVNVLKFEYDSTPQARRDMFLMTVLLDHGLRTGEMNLLKVGDFTDGFMRFYRPKVNKWSTHELTKDTRNALTNYGDYKPKDKKAPILKASLKDGSLTFEGMTANAISDRVRVIGAERGIEGLSAHDCRHSWATRAARKGTDPFALQEAGGWSSLAMPRRYIEEAKIANQGVKL